MVNANRLANIERLFIERLAFLSRVGGIIMNETAITDEFF